MEDFIDRHGRVIIKPLDADGFVRDGVRLGCFTSRITPTDAARFAHLAPLGPVFLQRELRKYRELRATVIGQRVFTCAIDASSHPNAEIDWRVAPPDQLPHTIVPLTPAIEAATAQARQTLRHESAEIAITLAGQIVGRNLDTEQNRALTTQWLHTV